jgi:V-type H+-transporting ATPase subunit a
VANNQLLFVNSFKMKASVLFGVTQMSLGVGLKFANSIYFKNYTDLIFECIPQLAFMLALFAYMDLLIMIKWVYPTTNSSPGLIDTMITMGLTGGGVKEGSALYSNQAHVQSILFSVAVWSVPLMLIPKPVILWIQHKFKTSRGRNGMWQRTDSGDDRSHLLTSTLPKEFTQEADEEFEMGEVAIHQAIETIEYVLGTVSHTASYLRLWALSLAHQQLSLVFIEKTLYAAMSSEIPMILNAVPIYIGFAVFLGVTTAILLGMDVMECFLHTLRLHWVEFQSKFYKADGVKFKPFSHKAVLLGEE